MDTNAYTAQFLEKLIQKDPAQRVFHQAVQEVVSTLTPVLQQNPKYIKERILERITEPERTIIFRVPWQDDSGETKMLHIAAPWGRIKAACVSTPPSTRTC